VRGGGAGSGFDFFLRSTGPPEGDVVADRAAEKRGLLQHNADLAAQAGDGHIADVPPVDRDPPLGDVVEARDQVDDRGLAAAGRAQQSHRLARLRDKAHVVQDRLPALEVTEGHILKGHPPRDRRHLHRAGPVGHLVLGIQDVEHALGGGRRLRHQRDDHP